MYFTNSTERSRRQYSGSARSIKKTKVPPVQHPKDRDHCDCGTEQVTAELFYKSAHPLMSNKSPFAVPLQGKLYGDISSLRLTTSFLGLIQIHGLKTEEDVITYPIGVVGVSY